MQNRIAGALVVAGALYFLWMAVCAVLNAQEITNMFADLDAVLDEPIDRARFLLHWRVAYALFAAGSFLGLIAGVAMLFLQRWSWLLLTGIAIVAFVIAIAGRVTGYTHYGFEGGGLKDLLILAVMGIASYVAYRKSQPAKTPNDVDA